MQTLVIVDHFFPNAACAKSSYLSDFVLSAQDMSSIPVYMLKRAPRTTSKFPVTIPVSAGTEGSVIVPAPKVATINENIEDKKPPFAS